ncbi:MAG: polysaccharide deacetylase family protein [Acidobacteriota bacterium]|nr:polysaccharide deacetylase family protein [Acidobacteriota bacterium]
MSATVALTSAASLLAASAGAAAYATLWPQSSLCGPVVVAGDQPSQIALTYDDGPNPAATPQLLEVLASHNVRATFFMIGEFVRKEPGLVREVAAAGHLIGNHTMTHPWLAWQSAARIRQELTGCSHLLEDTLGQPIRFFRPPHGARRPYVLQLARQMGMAAVQWNVTAFDWQPIPAARILHHLQRGIGYNRRHARASNVLLHDGGHLGLNQPRLASVQATAELLKLCEGTRVSWVTPEIWL